MSSTIGCPTHTDRGEVPRGLEVSQFRISAIATGGGCCRSRSPRCCGYFVYVILAAYAHDFMSQRLVSNINVGLVMGLLQFVTTFAVTWAYVRYADRVLDPRSARIRDEMEAEGLP